MVAHTVKIPNALWSKGQQQPKDVEVGIEIETENKDIVRSVLDRSHPNIPDPDIPSEYGTTRPHQQMIRTTIPVENSFEPDPSTEPGEFAYFTPCWARLASTYPRDPVVQYGSSQACALRRGEADCD